MLKSIRLCGVCILVSVLALSCGGGSPKTPNNNGGGGGGTPTGVNFTTPTSAPTIELGQSVNFTVSAPSGSAVTWTLANGNGLGKPAGTLTANGSSATYAAPPVITPAPACGSAPGPLQMTVTASDATGDSASLTILILQALPCIEAPITLVACTASSSATACNTVPAFGPNAVCPAPGTLIPPPTTVGIEPFVVGTFTSINFQAGTTANNGPPAGQPPYTWSLTGTLPAGLSLVPGTSGTVPSATESLQGTPVSAGCSAFTLQITDSLGASGTQQFFVVVVPPPLKVQSQNTAAGYGGESYPTTSLTAVGGVAPYSWAPSVNANSINPNSPEDLPPDLTLTFPQSSTGNATAVISGTINAQDVGNTLNNGTYPLFLQVSDSQSPYPAIGSPNLANIQVLAPVSPCQPADPLTPTSGYGGSTTGGNVGLNGFIQGNYAFLLNGFDANGPVAIAGSIQADGTGKILAGEEDVTRSGGSQTVTIVPAASSYTIGHERNRGCMTLQDSSGATSTFAFTVGACSNNFTLSNTTIGPDLSACGIMANGQGVNVPAGVYTSGRVIEFDSSGTHLSGILRMQDTSSFSAGLSGLYAFGLRGWDSGGKHYAAAGSAQAGSGSFTSVAADINDGGTLASTLTGGSGTVGSADANGRAAATLNVGSASFSLAVYLVSKSEAMVATTDLLSASHPVASGEAIGTAGPFSAASMLNTHMFHLSGGSGSGPDINIGLVTFDGISAFTGTSYENQAGTVGKAAASGLYTVDPNTGRTLFSASGSSQNFAHPFVAYVIPAATNLTKASCAIPAACVTGFLVGSDSTAQDGILEFQTPSIAPPPPFNNQYVQGDFTFGVDEALDNVTTSEEGFATAAASSSSLTSGTLNGILDYSFGDPKYCLLSSCTLLLPEGSFAGTYTVNSDGTGSFGGFNGGTVSVTNGRTIFYFDESPVNLHPSVIIGEQ